jgi:broad specificity phosphatase PhoE
LAVIDEPAFTDIHLGDWEGRSKREVEQEEPEQWKIWISRPERLKREGAETLTEVQERAYRGLQRIVQDQGQGERTMTIAVVSHRAVLKALIARCLGLPEPYFWKIHLDTAAYSILEHTKERGYMLTLLNQTCHLSDFVRETA